MYVIVVGAGEVGRYLARILLEEQHDVAIVEQDDAIVRELNSSVDALVVKGSGVSHRALAEAGIERADLLLAVTSVDEVNLIACMSAAKYGRRDIRTVARVRDANYLTGDGQLSARELGLTHIVGPERSVASEVARLLHYQGSGRVNHLAGDRVALLEMPLAFDSPLLHETIGELQPAFPEPSLIVGIAGPRGLRIPTGSDKIGKDERAYVLTTPENIDQWWILSGKPWHRVRHALIIGCGTIGLHVAKELESQKLYPTIIEIDIERAEVVANSLTRSIVLQGDGADPDLLQEQLDERSDAVVVLIDDDEKAVLLGIFAKHLGAKKVIVRSDRHAYLPIADKLGVDALISPRRAVANEILGLVKKSGVRKSHMLGDHQGELMAVRVPRFPKNESLLQVPVSDIGFPEDSIVAALIRGDEVSIAPADVVLAPNDELLIVCLPGAVTPVLRALE